MMNLSGVAETHLAAAPIPPQRYGLSIVLRKPYPVADSRDVSGPRVYGASLEQAGWEDLPGEIQELVRRRIAEDPVVAAHVLYGPTIAAADIRRNSSIVVESVPGSTLFLTVAPNTVVTVRESLLSAFSGESRSPGAGAAGAQSHMVLLLLGAGARVRWFGWSVGVLGFSMVERLALLGQDAVLEHHSALVAANAVRENIRVVLAASGATARINSLFVGGRTDQFDLGVTAEHRSPRTVSDLRAKGVLTGKAQGVYRGLVRVEKDAAGSDGYQRCDALLLSPTAEVDPVPNLEINTNDVRCTHGVTVSHVNAEQMFYLQSRSLSEAAARHLLIEGFAGTMLRSYDKEQRAALEAAIRETLQ